MKQNLKSFFKKAIRSKGSVSESTTPHQEPHPGPAQRLEQRRTQERESGTDQHRDGNSFAQSSQPSSHCGSSKPSSRRLSVQHPISTNGDHAVVATDCMPSPNDVPERTEDSFADVYRAYLPAVSSAAVSQGSDADFMSLGGDSRLRKGDSEMRHNEDVADRNIECYGSKSSRHSSLTSYRQDSQAAQGRRKSVAASIESLGAPDSVGGSTASTRQKYTLGTGIATEGSLIDGILPHVKDPHVPPQDRKDWPTRIARDESLLNAPRRNGRGNDDGNRTNTRRGMFGGRYEKTLKQKDDGSMDFREAIMRGPEGYKNGLRASLDGVMDLRDTEDADKETQWAPEVVHEAVKPHEHEIIEERIYREIHNHEVYHYIQPVYETEILPARHWVYNSKNELVEVPADKLPECTGANQRWSIVRGDREKANAHIVRSPPQAREPRIISDKIYTTPEGFERRESTILHPPELEDMSNYDGPVVPIEFLHHGEHAPGRALKKTETRFDHPPNDRQFTMEAFSEDLPVARSLNNRSSSSTPRPPIGNSTSTPRSEPLSIPRKSLPAVEC